MTYQTQRLIQTVVSVMALGICMGPPAIMLQTTPEHTRKRQELTDKYGLWEVKRAESVCPRGDAACIEAEASRLAGVLRARYW